MKTSLKLITLILLGAIADIRLAHAGSHTWSGANGVYFNNNSNWSYGGAPTNGEQDVYLYFPGGATHYTCSNNLSGLTVSGIGISGDNYSILGNSIAFKGTGPSLTDSGSLNGFYAPLVLVSNLTVNVSSGKALYLNGVISGSSGLTLSGAGTVQFNGVDSNTYTGTTYVNSGTLLMSRGSGLDGSIAGPLVVGTALGSQGTVFAKILSNNQIGNQFPVTVNFTGVLDAANNVDWIGGLILAGGTVQTGTGKFGLMGDIEVQAGPSSIDGNLALYNATNCIINAVPGGALAINATISAFNDSIGILKTGAGSVDFKASNTFGGTVTVKQGYLSLKNYKALGHSSGLFVTNSGIVQLWGVGITNVPATVSGNGNGNGALRAFGTSVWAGQFKLAGNSGIQPLAATDLLEVNASIYGTGNLTKLGAGTLVFSGENNNTYNGRTTVSEGTLELRKTNSIAIPGPLIIGDDTNAPNSRIVKLASSNQIDDLADVTVNVSGALDFTGLVLASETIGSLAGAGNVYLGFSKLEAGTNGATTTFSGILSGIGGSSGFTKQGGGILFLEGMSPSFLGNTFVRGGTLCVNGAMGNSPVAIYAGTTLAGDGATGPVSGTSGRITPGHSTGLFQSGALTLGFGLVLEMELNGLAAGLQYDQIGVTGSVSLGNASLNVILGFNSAVSNKFLLIANDGNDPVNGTFNGLPEGATFYASGAQFQITYHGGDGNDVEITQLALPQPSQINTVTVLPGGPIQILGHGNVGMVYGIEANSDLNTTNWVNIGAIIANQLGEISFTDTNAPNFSMRFYRFKSK